jgi:hypothetical protein
MEGCCTGIELPIAPSGADGKNAFTITTAAFAQPIVAGAVTIDVSSAGQYGNGFVGVGQILFITDGTNYGWYLVAAVIGTTQLLVINLGYPGSAAPGTSFALSSLVSPGGLQGPAGANGTGSAGPAGANGTSRIYEYLGARLTTATLNTFTNVSPAHQIPAATLTANGDEVVVVYESDVDTFTSSRGTLRRVMVNGSGAAMVSLTRSLTPGYEPSHEDTGVIKSELVARTIVRFIRTSSSTARVITTFDIMTANSLKVQRDLSSLDFTTAYGLFFEVSHPTANQVGLRTITMDLIKS